MDKCPKCGNKLSPIDVLCPRCGALAEVIHVASHPDAVPAKNADVVISRQPRPEDTAQQSDMPISRQARSAVNPTEEIPVSLPARDEANLIEEDDLPMSRQARKAAMQAKTKEAKRAVSGTDLSESSSKKWLEIEEIDPALLAAKNETEPEPIAADETEDHSLTETAEDKMFDAETDTVPDDNVLLDAQTTDTVPDDNVLSDAQTPDTVPDDNVLSDDTPRRYRTRSADEPVSEPGKTRRRSPVALIVLMWVVIAAAVFGAFYFLDTHVTSAYGGWDDFVRQLTNGKVELDTDASYLSSIDVNISETQTEDGAPAHRFDITMKSGKSIKVLPLGDTFNMDNGSVSFTIADEALARSLGEVSSESTIDTNDVSLEVTSISQTFTYPVTSLKLMLTEAIYTRESPSPDNQTSTEDMLPIDITVSPDAMVFINNASHTTEIDENGRLSVSMPLNMGENLFVIEVIQPGRRTVKENFKIIREEQRTPLTPNTDFLRVDESPFECLGKTAPGATLTATMDGQSFTALVAADGTFSLACKTDVIGIHELIIRASSEGYSDAEATVAVEYLPEPDAFMAAAKELSVGQIIKDLDSLGDTGIKATGTVSSLTSEKNKQTFTITKGSDSINCYYYGTVRLSENSSYTFYGVADSQRSSFYVMHVV